MPILHLFLNNFSLINLRELVTFKVLTILVAKVIHFNHRRRAEALNFLNISNLRIEPKQLFYQIIFLLLISLNN